MGAESPEPFFSILTTAYRTEQYLPEAIESVLSQTRGDWELIVVDNGYSDDIARIVGTYADDHRIGLIRQANRGYGGGVTAAAGTARGRVLTVLDSDDLLRPDFCERVGAVFEAEPHVAAVGCDATLFGFGDGTERGYLRSISYRNRKRHVDVPLTFSDVLGGIVPYYSGAVRRDVWNAVGGYTAPPVSRRTSCCGCASRPQAGTCGCSTTDWRGAGCERTRPRAIRPGWKPSTSDCRRRSCL